MVNNDLYPTQHYTGHEFIAMAKRGAFVRWYPSRKVERLRFEAGRILAGSFDLISGQTLYHVIGYNRRGYHCQEVSPKDSFPIEDMCR